MPRADKVEAVREIAARFSGSTAALLTDYRGLKTPELAELRRALKAAGSEYKVVKNTLARIAVKDVGLDELAPMLQGPTGVAFVHGDVIDAAKALDEGARRFPVLDIKGALVEGRVMDAEQASQLARLAPRDIQLAHIAALTSMPLRMTIGAVAALLTDLGSMLAQVLEEKEAPSG